MCFTFTFPLFLLYIYSCGNTLAPQFRIHLEYQLIQLIQSSTITTCGLSIVLPFKSKFYTKWSHFFSTTYNFSHTRHILPDACHTTFNTCNCCRSTYSNWFFWLCSNTTEPFPFATFLLWASSSDNANSIFGRDNSKPSAGERWSNPSRYNDAICVTTASLLKNLSRLIISISFNMYAGLGRLTAIENMRHYCGELSMFLQPPSNFALLVYFFYYLVPCLKYPPDNQQILTVRFNFFFYPIGFKWWWLYKRSWKSLHTYKWLSYKRGIGTEFIRTKSDRTADSAAGTNWSIRYWNN